MGRDDSTRGIDNTMTHSRTVFRVIIFFFISFSLENSDPLAVSISLSLFSSRWHSRFPPFTLLLYYAHHRRPTRRQQNNKPDTRIYKRNGFVSFVYYYFKLNCIRYYDSVRYYRRDSVKLKARRFF